MMRNGELAYFDFRIILRALLHILPGIPCREGPFTEIENEQTKSAITKYKEVGYSPTHHRTDISN
jgi:hypothetical protein